MGTSTASSTHRLTRCWASRYLPDVKRLPAQREYELFSQLDRGVSVEGRSLTANRVRRELKLCSEWAGIQTRAVFSSPSNVVDLAEARSLASYVEQAYQKCLDVYQDLPLPSHLPELIYYAKSPSRQQELADLTLPWLNQLVEVLTPVLSQLRERHLVARDPRIFGFLTTHFHFGSKMILDRLSLCEQVLLKPYLQVMEEQVCIPWQQICAAAAHYSSESPLLLLIEQLLLANQEIAEKVYSEAVQQFPNYYTQRGKFDSPDVANSSIRDLNMFQGYLWLCVLERDMAAIEQNLLPLCVLVFPNIGLKWSFVQQGMELLIETIFSRLTPAQIQLLRPYTHSLRWLFSTPPYEAMLASSGQG
jgi:hypothetical protein